MRGLIAWSSPLNSSPTLACNSPKGLLGGCQRDSPPAGLPPSCVLYAAILVVALLFLLRLLVESCSRHHTGACNSEQSPSGKACLTPHTSRPQWKSWQGLWQASTRSPTLDWGRSSPCRRSVTTDARAMIHSCSSPAVLRSKLPLIGASRAPTPYPFTPLPSPAPQTVAQRRIV